MVLAAWEALADRSLRRVLVAGALLWENLARARAAPDPCPLTGLGAMPPPEVRPKKITKFWKNIYETTIIWAKITFYFTSFLFFYSNTHLVTHLVKSGVRDFKTNINKNEKKGLLGLWPIWTIGLVPVIKTLFILKINYLYLSVSNPKRILFHL